MRVEKKRRGFTLVEILVVISIMIILVALIATTARVGLNYANASATRVLIDSLDTAIEEKMKTYYANNLSSPNITPYQILAGADSYAVSVDPNSAIGQRAAVIAKLDSLRSAFPQSFAEIVPGEELVLALGVDPTPQTPTIAATNDGEFEGFLSTIFNVLNPTANPSAPAIGLATAPVVVPDPAMQDIMIEYLLASKQIANKAAFTGAGGYRNIVRGLAASWSARPGMLGDGAPNPLNTATHNPETESAECLYLILQKDPVIEGIGAKFIKDTDGDGLLEFVDSFGKPIKWYRHAPDLFAYFIEVTQQYKSASTSRLELDGDNSEAEPVGDNSYDPQNTLYETTLVSPPHWWVAGGAGGTIGPIPGAFHKDVFECLFGRLHRAYNRLSPPNYSTPISPTDLSITALPSTGRNDSGNQNVPRPYPFRSVIVSAGGDGEFGLYSTTTDINGDGIPDATHPALHMGIKGGRVEEDPDRRAKLLDNIFSVELQEGLRQ